MASKFFPVSRASRLLRLQTPQYRSFSAAPQRYSDTLAVVRIPISGPSGIGRRKLSPIARSIARK